MRQRDQSDCGPTCLAYLCRRLGRPRSIALLRQWAGTDRGGTTALGLVQAAERAGLVLQGVRGQPADFATLPLPLIAHVVLPSRLHHYVVIERIGRRRVCVMDPAVGRRSGWERERVAGLCSGVFLIAAAGFADGQASRSDADRTVTASGRLWNLLRPHRPLVIQAVVGAGLATVLGLSMSLYVERLIDTVLPDQDLRLLLLLGVAMVGILAARLALTWIQGRLALRLSQRLDVTLMQGYHRHLLGLPRTFHDGMRVGELLARLGDGVKVRTFLSTTLVNLVLYPMVVVASLVGLFLYHPRIGLVAALLVLFQMLLHPVVARVNRARHREVMVCGAEWQGQLTESLGIHATVRALGLELRADQAAENHLVRLLRASRRSGEAGLWFGTLSQGATQAFTLATLWVGAWLVLHQQLSLGQLISAYTLASYLATPCAALAGLTASVQEALVATERLHEILDLEREAGSGTAVLGPGTMGDVCFDAVTYRPAGKLPVLHAVSLVCRRGELTLLAGPSGCGKSTLLALLQAQFRPESGHIRLGEVDLKLFDLGGLRRGLAVLPQQVELFSGTVLENVAPDPTAPDLPRLLAACREAGVLPWIESQPAGFGTWLHEAGVNLSGGQRQRLALARALYRAAPLLLLDEPTSALDPASESEIVSKIRARVEAGVTVIVVAHGEAWRRAADAVVWMEQGRVREQERLRPVRGA
ncbi:MAG: peptidase domain-containing ABC transporter [Opitutaceae bacterium]